MLGPPAFARGRRGGGCGFGHRPFGGLDGGGVTADMPDELWPGVGFDQVFMNLLGQLVLCKLGESAAEGRFAGYLSGAFPTAKLSQQRTGLQGVNERTGGRKLINVLGDERMRQPDARTRWSPVAAPFVTPGEAAQIGERNHFAELLVQGGECSQFCDERGKKLALKMVENDRQV